MRLAAVLYARDLDRLVAFYSGLGLTVDEMQPGDYAVLTAPQAELSIIRIPQPLAAQIEIADPPQVRSGMPIKLAFVVPSIDAALAVAGGGGGRVEEGASRWMFRDHLVQDAIDPEGNKYQLRQRQ